MNIMLVEDDEGLSRGIPLALANEEDKFFVCRKIREARKVLSAEKIDLVLLDIGLPDGDGLEFCREIRKEHDMYLIFLTANDMEYDEVAGLDAGADDYMTKPFSLAVLRSRIQVAKRRWKQNMERVSEMPVTIGDYHFSFGEQKFFRGTEEIYLSKTEQKLLKVLVSHPGQVMTREMLLDQVWGLDSAFLDENALSVAVGRLRNKLFDGKEGGRWIQTVYGIGYQWKMPEQDEERDGR